MALTRILFAWAVVVGWFLVWEAIAWRLGRGGAGPWLRAPLWSWVGEGLLLTLLAGLWFGSLGSGGWWLVFGLLGGLLAWPSQEQIVAGWRWSRRTLLAAILVVIRMVGAGALLAWRLSAP
ncbi:MAG: hypothetical protein ACREMG_06330 [Gemmatimonadales bacterium]